MTRRLIAFGLVILLAVLAGVLVRHEVMKQERHAAVPATPLLSPEASKDEAASSVPPGPSFDVVRIEPDGAAVVAGRAAPGSEVELLANGNIIDRTKANEAGEFVMMPPALEPGSHELTLRTPESGSRQAVAVSVPQQGKGDVLVVVGEPGKPSRVVQAGERPAAQRPTTSTVQIAAVEGENGRLFVQGSGPPGSKVVIYLNDAPVAEAQIGADGRWSLTVGQGLAAGDYKVRVDQLGPDGKVVARAEVPFVAEGPSQAPPVAVSDAEEQTASVGSAANPVVSQLGTVEVKRGDNLWQISRKAYGAGVRYSTIYEANADQIRDPNRIYPGQIFVMPGG